MALTKWTPTTDLFTLRRAGKLIEEGGEAIAVAARLIIQGIDEVDPSSGKVNRQRLMEELADLQAQILCTGVAFNLDQEFMDARVQVKLAQMEEWEAMFREPDRKAVLPVEPAPPTTTMPQHSVDVTWRYVVPPRNDVQVTIMLRQDGPFRKDTIGGKGHYYTSIEDMVRGRWCHREGSTGGHATFDVAFAVAERAWLREQGG